MMLTPQSANLEPSRKDIAEHEQRALIRAWRHREQRGIGVANTDIFGLCAIVSVSKDPACFPAGVCHRPLTELA